MSKTSPAEEFENRSKSLIDVATWVTGAFAGISAVVTSGLQLTGLGKYPLGSWQFFINLGLFALIAGLLGAIVYLTGKFRQKEEINLKELDQAKDEKFQKIKVRTLNTGLLLGTTPSNLTGVVEAIESEIGNLRNARNDFNEADKNMASVAEDNLKRKEYERQKDLAAVNTRIAQEEIGFWQSRINGLRMAASYYLLRENFNHYLFNVILLAVATVSVIAGLAYFLSVDVKAPKVEVVLALPSEAHVNLTEKGEVYIKNEQGEACLVNPLPVVLLTRTTDKKFDVVTRATETCKPFRFQTNEESYGTVTPVNQINPVVEQPQLTNPDE